MNVMDKFSIYLSIYYCLTCFALSISSSSEAGVLYKLGSGSSRLGMVSAPGRWHRCVAFQGEYFEGDHGDFKQ
jgi:hypothetical protein